MNKEERIQRINRVLKGYFSDSSNPRSILAKELMDMLDTAESKINVLTSQGEKKFINEEEEL